MFKITYNFRISPLPLRTVPPYNPSIYAHVHTYIHTYAYTHIYRHLYIPSYVRKHICIWIYSFISLQNVLVLSILTHKYRHLCIHRYTLYTDNSITVYNMFICIDFEGCYIIFVFYVIWMFMPFYATIICDKPFLCFVLWEYESETSPISCVNSVYFRCS